MSSLHIGFIAHEYPSEHDPGRGLARYVQRVSHMLVQRGHRVTVLVMSERKTVRDDKGVAVHELVWPERRLTSLPGGSILKKLAQRIFLRGIYPAFVRIWTAKHVARAVWRIHRQTPFDLLQATNCFVLGFSLRQNGKIPLITRVSNYQPLLRSANDRQRLFSTSICDWLEAKQVWDSDASFAPSNLLAKIYARFEAHQLEVIHTPIDPPDLVLDDSFYKENLEGKKYLLYFGGISRLKGADLIADLLPTIFQAYPDLFMVFVGEQKFISGKKAFDVILEKSKGFEDRVFCFSPLPKKLLFPVIQHSLAVLMPSRADNYPNACLEAQALGKVVIATRDSSLDEMVSDGITGFLAENGNVDSLRAAIERFLNLSETKRLQMETAVRANIQHIYQEDRVGRLERFYYDIIDDFSSKG